MKMRHWGAVFIALFIVSTIGIVYAQTIKMPAAQQVYSYDPMSLPFVSSDPGQMKPMGLGPLATGGDIFNIHAGMGAFSESVDVYIALYIPTIDPFMVYFINQDYTIVPASAGFVAWKKGVNGPIDEVLFSNVPTSLLPPGEYVVGMIVTPADDFSRYYLYMMNFNVGAGEGVVEVKGEGADLYAQHCASCHSPLASSTKKGRTAAQIQSAIDGNVGGMGGLNVLTPAQVQTIADAMAPRQAPPSAAMPMPNTPRGTTYNAVDFPVMSSNPLEAKPIGFGAAAQGGGTLSIMVDIGSFTGFVDIYFAMALSSLDNNIFVLGPDLSVQPLSAGLVPWKKGVTGPISETLIENIPVTDLPEGVYTFYLLAAPEGTMNTYFMWQTEVKIGGAPDGAALYAQNCAGCHGPLTSSRKAGATAARTQSAIDGNVGGMGGLKNLSAAQVQAIADALGAQKPTTPTTTDGRTLYNDFCASCHGSLEGSAKAGTTVGAIQGAIAGDVGGMGGLKNLSAAQVKAIADLLGQMTPPPPMDAPATTDGPTLYNQLCAGCHGPLTASGKAGATAARIQAGINGNAGGMGTLGNLSAAQVQAIADALAGQAPPPTPTTTDGAVLYGQLCASCHNPLATSTKPGRTATAIQTAINGNVGNMGTPTMKGLTAVQVQAIANALPAPPVTTDGVALYAQNCESCHNPLATSTKPGRTATAIQTAINGNVGGMGGLSILTAAQVQAIANALPPMPTDGPGLYAANCASCHGDLASSDVRGTSANDIQDAIANEPDMASLAGLSQAEIQLIANALNGIGAVPRQERYIVAGGSMKKMLEQPAFATRRHRVST